MIKINWLKNRSKPHLIVITSIIFVVAGLLILVFFTCSDKKSITQASSLPPHAKDSLIIKFRPEAKSNIIKEKIIKGADIGLASVNEINNKEGVEEIKKLGNQTNSVESSELDRLYLFKFKEDKDTSSLIEEYKKNPLVEYAEPDVLGGAYLTPDDPYYSSSNSWGQGYDDMWGLKKIQAAEAWDISTGSNSIVVGVVDSGIDYNHFELAGKVWTNNDEIPDNSIDDDNNGYVDDYYGYDFVNTDSDPFDDHGHGTHLAGTIGAATNNTLGIAGINWQVKVMAPKIMAADGGWSLSSAIQGVQYAVDNGAKVINCSWGVEGIYHSFQDVVDYAVAKGAAVVAAAGNENDDCSNSTPAGLEHVVAVSATDVNDNKAPWSDWGSVIDVAAPGVDILSLKSSGGSCITIGTYYCHVGGTSFAASHVSGEAALLMAKNPNASPAKIAELISQGVDDLGDPGKDIYFGNGRINLFNALSIDITYPSINHTNGAVLKSSSSPTIYYLDSGEKRPFPSGLIYLSWFDWDDFISISDSEINFYPQGSEMNLKSGTLVKSGSSPAVYVISDKIKHVFESAWYFEMYGYSWSNIVAVPDSELDNYTSGEGVGALEKHPDGTLVRANDSSTVYYMDEGQRRPVPNVEVFSSQFRWKDIAVVPPSGLKGGVGTRISFAYGTLARAAGNSTVYVITDGEKRPIASASVFMALGYSWSKIIVTTTDELSNYPTGEMISF